jgi:hypothetical protein
MCPEDGQSASLFEFALRCPQLVLPPHLYLFVILLEDFEELQFAHREERDEDDANQEILKFFVVDVEMHHLLGCHPWLLYYDLLYLH